MKKVISAGGIVYHLDGFLMLQKKNGDWVLPKGRIEIGESLEEAAVREVKEETNIDATIVDYIGVTSYTFSNFWTDYKVIDKVVSWYLMVADSYELKALVKEGFVKASFVPIDKALQYAKYEDEKIVIRKALIAVKEKE